MGKALDWFNQSVPAWSTMIKTLIGFMPQFIGAFALILLGWIIARLIRAVTVKAFVSLDRFSTFVGIGKVSAGHRLNPSILTIVGNVAFWLVILIFITAAANLLGLTLFAGWLDRVINHLPNLLSGALIIFAGYVFGNLVGDTVRTAAQTMAIGQREILARSTQIFTVTTMILIGIDQIGIDITVLVTFIAISVGALLGGVAIAFSLGSSTLVSNLIGAHYLSKDYRVGEAISVGGISGTIVGVTSVAVILETEEGRMTVPAKVFGEEASLLISREGKDGR